MRRAAAALFALAVGCGTAAAQPAPSPSAAPSATPQGALIRFAGQLLDVQRGFAFFTTGDAFKVAPNVRIVDAAGGAPSTAAPTTRMYARATFDANGTIVELALSPKKLAPERDYAEIKRYAVALSPVQPNPDLAQNASGLRPGGRVPLTGKIASVRFVVRVPATTGINDPVYMARDVDNWTATGIRLERIDGVHYAVTIPLRSGTDFSYKYTRGSWRAEERGRTGLQDPPRHFFLDSTEVGELDAKVKDDTVYAWADDNPSGSAPGPNAIPTPFNPCPFATPVSKPQPVRAPGGC